MNRLVRHALVPVIAILLVVWGFAANTPSQAAVQTFPVTGQTLQLFRNDVPTFKPIDANNNISGTSYPVSIICPGNVDLQSTYSGQPFCTNPSGAGMRGWVVTKEQVVRKLADPQNPTFDLVADLAFSGAVFLNGKSYNGTMMLKMVVSGPLNNPSGVDCKATPENALCGAKSFTGTWEILRLSGGGELGGMYGSGTITWLGCTDPNNPATCAFPTYQVRCRTNTRWPYPH